MIVTLVVKDGWHLYANPTGVPFLKPTTVTLPPASRPRSPRSATRRAPPLATPGSPEKASVYEGKIMLTARVRLDAKARPGPLTLSLRLSYQACNDRACLAPATLNVPLALTIAR